MNNADTIVSDLIIGAGDIDETNIDEYMKAQSPVGYLPFRRFVEGEYRFKDAILKAEMDSKGAERVVLRKFTSIVDLPDVRDRGKVSVPATAVGIRVDFTRSFYTQPEIITQLIGGTVLATPHVLDEDKEGFTVVLKNNSGGYESGNISWYAEGY